MHPSVTPFLILQLLNLEPVRALLHVDSLVSTIRYSTILDPFTFCSIDSLYLPTPHIYRTLLHQLSVPSHPSQL